MKKRRSNNRPNRRHIIIILAVALLVIAGAWIAISYFESSPAGAPAGDEPQSTSQQSPRSKKSGKSSDSKQSQILPATISIPNADVDKSPVVGLGIDGEGNMAAPATNQQVGWYTGSSSPGSGQGAVLLDGHVGLAGETAVFSKLHNLSTGDVITVTDTSGKSYNYKVYGTEELPIAKVDMRKMLRSVDSNREGLNIITCSGDFDSSKDTYDNRLLVYAVRN